MDRSSASKTPPIGASAKRHHHPKSDFQPCFQSLTATLPCNYTVMVSLVSHVHLQCLLWRAFPAWPQGVHHSTPQACWVALMVPCRGFVQRGAALPKTWPKSKILTQNETWKHNQNSPVPFRVDPEIGHLNLLAAVWASGPTCLNPPPVMNLAPRIFWSQYSYDLLWSLLSYNIWCHSDVTVPRLCRDVQAILHLRSDLEIFTRPLYHNIISVLESEPRPASTRVWPSVECDDQSKLTQKSSEIHVHPRAMIWVWAEIGPL